MTDFARAMQHIRRLLVEGSVHGTVDFAVTCKPTPFGLAIYVMNGDGVAMFEPADEELGRIRHAMRRRQQVARRVIDERDGR